GGGTRVKVWIKEERAEEFFNDLMTDEKGNLAETCARIAPCLDVTLRAGIDGGKVQTAVEADDWLQVDDSVLLRRIASLHWKKSPQPGRVPVLRVLQTENGEPAGRAALWVQVNYREELA